MLSLGGDWHTFFRPAALSPKPYSVVGNYNAPWFYLFVWPLAMLPTRLGAAVLAALTVVICMAYLRKPSSILLLAASPALIATIYYSQVEGLVLLGLMWNFLPLLLVKQSALLAAIPRLRLKTILPLAAVVAATVPLQLIPWLSAIRYGRFANMPQNHSLFPGSLLLVPVIAVEMWRKPHLRRSDALWCWLWLCCCPYWAIHSALAATAATIKETPRQGALVVIATWLLAILR